MGKKETIAHHEAGHAVIARVLDIPVSYATLDALDGASGGDESRGDAPRRG